MDSKILIITAVFPPEPIVSSKLSFDIADKLSETYEVTILHPRSSRPYGFSFAEKASKTSRYEEVTVASSMCVHNLNWQAVFMKALVLVYIVKDTLRDIGIAFLVSM